MQLGWVVIFFLEFFYLFWPRGLFEVFAGLGKGLGKTSVLGFVLRRILEGGWGRDDLRFP